MRKAAVMAAFLEKRDIMESARIKAFIASANQGSFTAAGKYIGYSPSGISQLVSALEDELGFSLLIRKSRGVSLTREGEMLDPEAVDYINKEKNFYRVASELGDANSGQLVIAAYSSIASQVLPAIIREFSEAYPSISITLNEGTKAEVEDMICSNRADLAFTTRLNNRTFSWIPFMEDPMVIVLPHDHKYAKAEAFPIGELASEELILSGEGKDMDALDCLRRNNIEPNIRFATTKIHTAISMTEEGLGVSVMNRLITKSWKTTSAIIPLDPPETITIGITLLSLEDASPAVRKFILFAMDRLTRHTDGIIRNSVSGS